MYLKITQYLIDCNIYIALVCYILCCICFVTLRLILTTTCTLFLHRLQCITVCFVTFICLYLIKFFKKTLWRHYTNTGIYSVNIKSLHTRFSSLANSTVEKVQAWFVGVVWAGQVRGRELYLFITELYLFIEKFNVTFSLIKHCLLIHCLPNWIYFLYKQAVMSDHI